MEHLKAFLKNPKRMGFPMPTPDKDTDLLVDSITDEYKYIVELGTGEGNVTKKILLKMNSDARLVSIEKCKDLYLHSKKKINDKRVVFVNDDAKNLLNHISKEIDCIISTLPLVLMLPKEKKKVIKTCYDALHPGGIYVQIQYAKLDKKKLEKLFSEVEIKNHKAVFVYVCKK